MEQMKERFAKLLLGEDMSGGGKGVSSALALSNAITNLAGRLTFSLLCNFLIIHDLQHQLENNTIEFLQIPQQTWWCCIVSYIEFRWFSIFS